MSDEEEQFQRPARELAGIAATTFEAFNAMQATKQRHFDLLQTLDSKKTRYGLAPTNKESALLEGLLADHDMQVSRFTAASAALKQLDTDAHLALFRYIALLESAGNAVAH